MSKTVSTELKNHMGQPVTTMAVCWLLVRTDDTHFGFTTLDMDLTVEDQLYKSSSGFSRSAIVNNSTGEVSNLEVLGYFSEDGIVERDLRNGKFNYASVYLFAVNWMDLTMGICRLKRGYLGECVRAPSGAFSAELRGLTQLFVQEFGNVWSPLCRADLGDKQCKIPIYPDTWLPHATYPPGAYVRPLAQTSDSAIIGTFQSVSTGDAESAGTEPTWDYTEGDTTTDGAVTWKSLASLRNIGEVVALVDQRSFQSTHLLYPGNQTGDLGIITFIANITAGTAIEISDGIVTYSHFVPFDTPAGSVRASLLADISGGGSGLNMTVDGSNPSALFLTNHSGKQGAITKAGDLVPGMRIQDFAPNYLDGGTILWLTGLNAGLAMELKTYDINNVRVVLWLAMKYAIVVGDRFLYYAGCDKRRDTCDNKFHNTLNNRSEPDMPGVNRMLSYPDAV